MVKEPICLFILARWLRNPYACLSTIGGHWLARRIRNPYACLSARRTGETDKEPVRVFAPAMPVTTKIFMHWKSSELTIQFGDPALLDTFGLRRSQEFELTSFHSVVSGDGIQRCDCDGIQRCMSYQVMAFRDATVMAFRDATVMAFRDESRIR